MNRIFKAYALALLAGAFCLTGFTGLHAAAGDTLWTFLTGSDIAWSSPAIADDGTIYIGSTDSIFYAINPDGTAKWSYPTGDKIKGSPAVADDGTIYIGSSDNKLYAINPDGTLKWSYTTGNDIYSSPAIGNDGTIYVGSWDSLLYAINPDSTLKWSYSTGGIISTSSPAVGLDGTIYVGSSDYNLYAINPDGTQKWVYTTGGTTQNSSPAIGSDGTIYVGSGDNSNLYAINPDGTLKWNYTAPSSIWYAPAIDNDGTIYVGVNWDLYSINPDGTVKWNYTTGGGIESSPTVGSDGTIYVGSDDTKLYAFNPDGTVKWSYTTGGMVMTTPAIGSDGTLYIGSLDNKIYAFDTGTGAGLADSPWPKFHRDLKNTGSLPAPSLQLASYHLIGDMNNNGVPNPGERVTYELYFKNTGTGTLDVYGAPEEGFAPYVVPATAAGFGFGPYEFSVNPGDSVMVTLGGGSFYIASDIPLPHECKLPIMLYHQGTDALVLVDTLRFTVDSGSDEFPPEVHFPAMGLVPVGAPATILVPVQDGGAITSATAGIRNQQDTTILYATLTLYDDGTNGDTLAGDNYYSALFTPADTAGYWIDVHVEDSYGNLRQEFRTFRFTTKPFQVASPVLFVGGASEWDVWQIGQFREYMEALDALGYSYDFYDSFIYNSAGGTNTTLPDSSILLQYQDGVVVFCGYPDAEAWRKFNYMQGLNISLWVGGEDIASLADWQAEFAATASTYWGVNYVSNHVGLSGVQGAAGDPVADGLSYQLSGEHWDEMSPAGDGVASMNYIGGGPAAIRNDPGAYKTFVTGFPLSAINTFDGRVELAERVMSWLYPEFGTRVRELEAYSVVGAADTSYALVHKIFSFTTSSNGGLSVGDTIAFYFDMPAGSGITFTSGVADSVEVALADSIFTAATWAYLSADTDTLLFIVPLEINPLNWVQVKIRGFLNPDQGLYDYAVRTNSDFLWVQGQMEILNYPYPLVMTLDSLRWDFGNNDRMFTIGERIDYRLEYTNMGFETISFHAQIDDSLDQYLNPPSAANDYWLGPEDGTLDPGQTHQFDLTFWISSYAPEGHELRIPILIYTQGTDELVGLDTLRFVVTGSDQFGPWTHMTGPGMVPVGQPVLLPVQIWDGAEIVSASVEVLNQQDSSVYASFTLYDDGAGGGDTIPGDYIFTATFTPPDTTDYWVNVTITDDFGNTNHTFWDFRFTTRAFQVASPLLLVSGTDRGYPWQMNLIRDYTRMLETLEYTYDLWDGYMRTEDWWGRTTLPDSSVLAQYQDGLVIYFNSHVDLGYDDWRKLSQMKNLNINLWAMGENFGRRAEWDSDFATVLGDYMGAVFVQQDVGMEAVNGVSGDPVAHNMSLPLQQIHLYELWDEMDPTGDGVISMTYGDIIALASAGDEDNEEPGQGSEAEPSPQSMLPLMRPPAADEIPAGAREAYLEELERSSAGPSPGKTKGSAGAGLSATVSSGAGAIRTEPGTYKTFITSFALDNIISYNKRLELTDRVMEWLYTPYGTTPRDLELSADSLAADTAGALLDKIVGLMTSYNGALAVGDSIILYFDMPDGSAITYTVGLADSILVALADSGFTPSLWAYLSADTDTLFLGTPVAVDPLTNIQVRINSFLNPETPGLYEYGISTQADRNWAKQQIPVMEYPYPLAMVEEPQLWDQGNRNGIPNPGERLDLALEYANMGFETLDFYVVIDTSFDEYVNPPTAAEDFWFQPSESMLNPGEVIRFDLGFWVSSYAPSGHELKLPIMFYTQENDELVGVDTLRFIITGSDQFGPESWMESPGFVPVGQPVLISIVFSDGAEITSATAEMRNMDTGQSYGTLTLFDDGTNGDTLAGDGWFSAVFTPPDTADYWIDVFAQDEFGNSSTWTEAYRFTSRPFQVTSQILLVNENECWNWWEISRCREALDNLGYAYDHYDSYVRKAGEWDKSLPDSSILAQYADGVAIHLGTTGWENNKLRYMKDLNISFWAGGDDRFSVRSQWDDDFATILGDYFGTAYVQDYVGLRGIFGVPGDPVADGLSLDMGWDSWDELDPIGTGMTAMTYGDYPSLAAASADSAQAGLMNAGLQRQRMPHASILAGADVPDRFKESYFNNIRGVTGGTSAGKTKTSAGAALSGIVSSGSAAIRNDPGAYRSFIQGFHLGHIRDYGERLDFADRVMSWLAAPADSFLLSVGTATAVAGGSAGIGFTLTSRDSIAALEIKVLLDTTKVVYVPGTYWIDDSLWPGAEVDVFTMADTLYINLSHPSDRHLQRMLARELFSVELQARPWAPEETVEIPLIRGSVKLSDGTWEPITRLNPGSLTIERGFFFSIGQTLNRPGETVPVPMYLENHLPVPGLDFLVSYDSTLATPVSFESPWVTDSLYEIYTPVPGQRRYHMVFSEDLPDFAGEVWRTRQRDLSIIWICRRPPRTSAMISRTGITRAGQWATRVTGKLPAACCK